LPATARRRSALLGQCSRVPLQRPKKASTAMRRNRRGPVPRRSASRSTESRSRFGTANPHCRAVAVACWRGCGSAASWGWARICPMPWRRRNERSASSSDAKSSARGEGSVATDQCCIVTLTLLPALVVATMPVYRRHLLVPARSWRTWPTLEPSHQRPLIGWLQPFGRRGGVAVIDPSLPVNLTPPMAAVRQSAAARLNRFNAGSRPGADRRTMVLLDRIADVQRVREFGLKDVHNWSLAGIRE